MLPARSCGKATKFVRLRLVLKPMNGPLSLSVRVCRRVRVECGQVDGVCQGLSRSDDSSPKLMSRRETRQPGNPALHTELFRRHRRPAALRIITAIIKEQSTVPTHVFPKP